MTILSLTNIVLLLAISLTLYRLFAIRSIWDKLLSLNLLSIKMLLLFTIISVDRGDPNLLDISMTFAILSFLVVLLLSRFVIMGGRTK